MLQEFLSRLSLSEKKYAPRELFAEGNESLLFGGSKVSVVGSRKASSEGLRKARLLTATLVAQGITVVSGLAEGIDTAAHETAIAKSGKTIAVLGTPLNIAYPAKNKALLDLIKRDHLALSQFPIGSTVYPNNFPTRNRTMALISDATVIVEASEQSGTIHQGWEALRLGRLLFIFEEMRALPWAEKMISYGAQVITLDTMEEYMSNLPCFSPGVNYAF